MEPGPARRWAPPLLTMAVIFVLSSRPVPEPVEHVPDYLTHGAAWALLAVLLLRALAPGRPRERRAAVLAFAIALGWGVLDEFHQSFVPGRMSDPWDVGKDAAGALLGLAAYRARERPGDGPAA